MRSAHSKDGEAKKGFSLSVQSVKGPQGQVSLGTKTGGNSLPSADTSIYEESFSLGSCVAARVETEREQATKRRTKNKTKAYNKSTTTTLQQQGGLLRVVPPRHVHVLWRQRQGKHPQGEGAQVREVPQRAAAARPEVGAGAEGGAGGGGGRVRRVEAGRGGHHQSGGGDQAGAATQVAGGPGLQLLRAGRGGRPLKGWSVTFCSRSFRLKL